MRCPQTDGSRPGHRAGPVMPGALSGPSPAPEARADEGAPNGGHGERAHEVAEGRPAAAMSTDWHRYRRRTVDGHIVFEYEPVECQSRRKDGTKLPLFPRHQQLEE